MNQSNGTASLDPLFKARRVAVLGASSDPSKIGGIPVVLLRDNFSGEIIPVNPNRSEIAGLPCCPDIASIDGKVELAIIALPRGLVEKGVTECLDAGVDAIVVNPADPAGIKAALEEATKAGIVVVAVDQTVTEPSAYVISNDQEEYGYVGAKWLFDQLGGSGEAAAGVAADGGRCSLRRRRDGAERAARRTARPRRRERRCESQRERRKDEAAAGPPSHWGTSVS